MVTARLHPPASPLSWNAYWLRGIGVAAAKYAPLPLRLMLGITFLFHGAPKIINGFAHQQFALALTHMGFPLPNAAAWFVGFVEVIGGTMMLFGAAVGVAAIFLFVEMLVAMFAVHARNGFSFMHGGVEIPLLLMAAILAVFIGGAGAFSFDEWWTDRDARAVGRAPKES
jgi:putative oxidoreductase